MAGKKGRSGRRIGSLSGFKNPVNIVVHHAQVLLECWRAVTGGHASSLVRLRACEKASAHVTEVYADKIKRGETVMPSVEQVLKIVSERRRPAIGDRAAQASERSHKRTRKLRR
jgi:hypothetical protein